MQFCDLLESFDHRYQYTLENRSNRFERYKIISNAILDRRLIVYEVDFDVDIEGVSVPAGEIELSFTRTTSSGVTNYDSTGDFRETGENPLTLMATIIDIAKNSSLVKKNRRFYFLAKEQKKLSMYLNILRRLRVKVSRGSTPNMFGDHYYKAEL